MDSDKIEDQVETDMADDASTSMESKICSADLSSSTPLNAQTGALTTIGQLVFPSTSEINLPAISEMNSYFYYGTDGHNCEWNKCRTRRRRHRTASEWGFASRQYNWPWPNAAWKARLADKRMRRSAMLNDVEALEEILQTGNISPNVKDAFDRTPLHIAASKGFSEAVQLLLRYGADPNLVDVLGNTPLHLAACSNHFDVVATLVKSGKVKVEISAGNDAVQRFTPLQLARSKLKILKHHPETNVIRKQMMAIVELLVWYFEKREKQTEEKRENVVDADLLSSFQKSLQISDTKEDIVGQVDSLSVLLDKMSVKNIMPK